MGRTRCNVVQLNVLRPTSGGRVACFTGRLGHATRLDRARESQPAQPVSSNILAKLGERSHCQGKQLHHRAHSGIREDHRICTRSKACSIDRVESDDEGQGFGISQGLQNQWNETGQVHVRHSYRTVPHRESSMARDLKKMARRFPYTLCPPLFEDGKGRE